MTTNLRAFDWKHWLSLPTEIVREIFLRCPMRVEQFDSEDTSLDSISWEFCSPSIHYSPLNLSHVCRWWRTLTLSMPELWTSLSLAGGLEDPRVVAELCSTWLARSGELPLSIGMKIASTSSGADIHRAEVVRRVGHAMLAAALPYLPRWNKVWIDIPQPLSFPLHFNNSATMLKYLHLSALSLPNSQASCTTTLLQHAPHIQQLTLDASLRNHQPMPDSWSPLHFQLVDTLNHFPVLNHVEFTTWNFAPTIVQPLFLPCLTRLSYKVNDDSTDILKSLILPSLTTLVIAGDRAAIAQAIPLIKRSACGITHLSVQSSVLFECNIIDLLHHTPSLVELRLFSSSDQPTAVDRFLSALSDRNVIPLVESIHLERMREVSASSITSFLKARKDGPLQSCHLVFDFVSKGTMLWNHMQASAPVVSFSYDETADFSASWSDEWGSVAL